MKQLIALSALTMALTWALPGQAQDSPAPEHSGAGAHENRSAAENGVTGNDGSAAGSGGEDNRSDRTSAANPDHAKPDTDQVGDKTDYSGNEGTDTESTGKGTGHGTATKDADSAKQTQGSGTSDSSGG